LSCAAAAAPRWPLPEELTDSALEALLFVRAGATPGIRRKPEPDWFLLHRQRNISLERYQFRARALRLVAC
jgi:transposase